MYYVYIYVYIYIYPHSRIYIYIYNACLAKLHVGRLKEGCETGRFSCDSFSSISYIYMHIYIIPVWRSCRLAS